MKNAFQKVSLLVVIAMFVTACSSSPKPNSSETEAPKTVKASESPVKSNPVTLKLFTSTGAVWGENKGLLAIVDNFQKKYPNIKVEVEPVPKMEEVLPVRIATADFPDIAYYHTGAQSYKVMKAEDNLVELSELNINSRLAKGLETSTKYNGKVYSALLGNLDVSGIIYNKAVFDKLGLQIPTNKQQFLDISEKIKAAGIIPFVMSGKDAWSLQLAVFDQMASYQAANKDWIKDINTRVTTFDKSPAFVQTLKDLGGLKDKGYINSDVLSTSYEKAQELLGTGKAAMFEMATWVAGDLATKYPDAKFGLFANPIGNDKPVVSTFYTGGLMVFNKGKHVKEAKQFVEFATAAESLKIFYDANPAIPAYKDINSPLNPISQDGNKYVQSGQVEVDFKDQLVATIDPLFPTALQDLLVGKTAEEVAKKIQTTFETNAKSQQISGF